jgi:hypothetical protein
MKKMLATLLFMPMIAFSQSDDEIKVIDIPAHCISYSNLDILLEEFDELPLIRGISSRETETGMKESMMVLFMNKDKATWTLVEKMDDKTYCILAVGSGIEPVPGNIIQDIQKRRLQKKS